MLSAISRHIVATVLWKKFRLFTWQVLCVHREGRSTKSPPQLYRLLGNLNPKP